MAYAKEKNNVAGWIDGPCTFYGCWIIPCTVNPSQKLVGGQHRKMEAVIESMVQLFCKVTTEIPNRALHLFPGRVLSTKEGETPKDDG